MRDDPVSDTPDEMREYRKHLVESRQKAFESFDRTILTLSAGGLALSLNMVKELSLSGKSILSLMVYCWILWLLSMSCTLISFYASQRALTKALAQFDNRTSSEAKVGGRWTMVVDVSNLAAMASFVMGAMFVVWFVIRFSRGG
jgi:hypothetical protein